MHQVPDILAGPSGSVQKMILMESRDKLFVRCVQRSVNIVFDVHEIVEEPMVKKVPERRRDSAFQTGEKGASGQSVMGEMTNTNKSLNDKRHYPSVHIREAGR